VIEMDASDITQKVQDKPLTVTAAIAVLLFWILVPLLTQKYFNYSAINTSFAITVFYFVGWKLYEHFS
jgi:hypothetical protein